MSPRGCVAGRPILDAMTLNKDVMRARVALWNVARRLTCDEEDCGEVEIIGEAGRYKVVDSSPEISRTRKCVDDASSVYGRA